MIALIFPLLISRNKTWRGIAKFTGFRGTKPPYQVFRRGFNAHILGLSQLVMRQLDNACATYSESREALRHVKRGRYTGSAAPGIFRGFSRPPDRGLIGTSQDVSRVQLPAYLADLAVRHNRRRQLMAAFQTLLGLGTTCQPNRATASADSVTSGDEL